MRFFKEKLFMVIASVAIFVMFQNFARIDSDPVEKMVEKQNMSNEDLLEKSIDLKLMALEPESSDSYLAKKCFETRVVCYANRNHQKCIDDKVHQFLRCSKIKTNPDSISLSAQTRGPKTF